MKTLHALLALLTCAAAAPFAQSQVAASIVSSVQSVQPGKPFDVALRLVHQPHWHSYWVNPGTGLPTTLKWQLPEGWTASDIRWPVPSILSDTRGNVVGNGYEGDLLLPVTLTPPANLQPGSKAILHVTADWLMCQDVCIPGSAKLQLSVAVADGPAAPDPVWGPKIAAVEAALPTSDPAWSASAGKDAKSVTLDIRRAGMGGPSPAPSDLHFFSQDGVVGFDQPQDIRSDGDGGFILKLAVGEDAPQDATRLVGVLKSSRGWRSDGSLSALAIDVPFGTLAPAAPLAAGTSGSGPASSFALTLVLAFAGGLILNLMPCVFPVLGIKILGFVNQAGAHHKKVTVHGFVYTAGVILSFWALAGLLAVLRAGGSQLGWGFQLQSAAFVFGLTAALLAFALNLSGVFEFGLSATGVGSGLQSKSGLSGSFMTGVLATIAATPCSAPFLAPALGAALALSTAQSFAIFTVIGIGLSTPYLILSAFPGAIKVLPRPGAWMDTFKQLMAFPLYATVAYLVWVLAGQLTETGLLSALFGLVLVAMGTWAYGRWHAAGASVGRARFGMTAGAVLIAAGLFAGWPVKAAPDAVTWDTWSPEAVAKLRADNRIIYVDFTARWCATCQANKRIVFHSPEVLKQFRDKKIATLRADWTNKDPQITAELAAYNRAAVPFDLIWLPGRDAPLILPELLTPSVVLGAVAQ